MSIELTDIQKLSPAEKIALYSILENDPDVNGYEPIKDDDSLFEEINNRDEAYKKGTMKLTTIEELETRLRTNS